MRTFGGRIWRRPALQAHERLFLNPFTKWRRHGRFPWKFAGHMLLVVLVTCQVLYYSQRDVEYYHRTIRHFSQVLLGVQHGEILLTTHDELRHRVREALHNAFFMNNVSISYYAKDEEKLNVYLAWRNHPLEQVRLSRSAFVRNPREYLNKSLGVVFDERKQEGLPMISSIWFNLNVIEPGAFYGNNDMRMNCYKWKLTWRLVSSARGELEGSLSYAVRTCDETFVEQIVALHLAVIAVSSLCLCLIVIKILRARRIWHDVQRAWSSINGERQLLPQDARAIYSPWWWFAVSGHILQIVCSALFIFHVCDLTFRFQVLGFSSFLTWLTICQYFEYFPAYYTTFSTMEKGVSSVFRYIISIIPILSAFAFFGVCNFWKTRYFSDFGVAYVSLFSLLNGDMVHDAFDAVGQYRFGEIYLYSFIFVFIYVVLNVNITIIEQAYYIASRRRQNEADTSVNFLGTDDERIGGDGVNMGVQLGNFANSRPEGATPLLVANDGSSASALSLVAKDVQEAPTVQGAQSVVLAPVSRVSSSSIPAAGRSASLSPLMEHRLHGMSPRYIDNPRLQTALAVAQGEARGSACFGALSRSPSLRDRATAHGGNTREADDGGSSKGTGAAHVSALAHGGMPRQPRRGEPSDPRAGDGSHVDRDSAAWWEATLLEWTRRLRSEDLPRPAGDEARRRSEYLLAGLAVAADQAAAWIRGDGAVWPHAESIAGSFSRRSGS